MKNKLFLLLAFILIFAGGTALGFYIRSQTINPRATIPNVFNRLLTFFVKQGVKEDDDLLYHDVGLLDFIANGSTKTKVAVQGTVDKITHEPDGDYHINLRPQNFPSPVLVTEAIPEIKNLPLPQAGDNIRIWGITRFDEPHNWWELHPVIGWEKIK